MSSITCFEERCDLCTVTPAYRVIRSGSRRLFVEILENAFYKPMHSLLSVYCRLMEVLQGDFVLCTCKLVRCFLSVKHFILEF